MQSIESCLDSEGVVGCFERVTTSRMRVLSTRQNLQCLCIGGRGVGFGPHKSGTISDERYAAGCRICSYAVRGSASATRLRFVRLHERPDLRPFGLKGGDAGRIEMRAGEADDLGIGFVDGPGGLVGSL
jgi:hypothetical protein